MKRPKKWDVTKEEELVAACITVNNLCNELQLPALIPMDAARIILDYSRQHVEDLRKFPLLIAESASKLVQ